ncbi:MAG: pyruvate formate lyase family protein [Candidatus Brocadiia bacterium]
MERTRRAGRETATAGDLRPAQRLDRIPRPGPHWRSLTISTNEKTTIRFTDERAEFERELDEYYSTYPTDMSEVEAEMDRVSAEHPEWGPCRRKAIIYETVAELCPVKVFRHFPFYYELDTGLPRHRWGSHRADLGGLGGWLMRQPKQMDLKDRAAERLATAWWELGLSSATPVFDFDHHCPGYDNVLRLGLNGIIAQAEDRLERGADERGRDFLEGVVIGNRSLIRIAERFSDEAKGMAAREDDTRIRQRLEKMAGMARRVPALPAETFHEALNVILFMRQVLGGLEGLGQSILGHLDRMLGPYLEGDLEEGRLTMEEAEDLIQPFLAMTDVKFNIREEPRETSTTVMVGGCDRDGTPVFNDVTRLIVDAYRTLELVNPKLNARISLRHPDEYFELLAELNAEGRNVLAFFNDDVLIEANQRMGKAVEDCRLYVSGGCQENVLQNTEINSRASIYLNLAQVFLMGFFPERWADYTGEAGIEPETYEGAQSYQEFHRRFLGNLEAVVGERIDTRNRTEKEGWWYNPCPLHSSTLDDCIENALDMMDGGTRYAGASVSLIGVGTLVDSLRAVRHLVYERADTTLQELADALDADFEGREPLRQYLVNRLPKYGTDVPKIRQFSARLFSDLARVSSGRPNTRGGRYEASVFVYRAFVWMGNRTGATPDGRRAGEPLSQGMGPSPLALGQDAAVTTVLSSLEPLELEDYPVAAVLDVKLPYAPVAMDTGIVVTLLRRFLDFGGSVLEFNVVDPEELRDAREHPERHGDLVVRVSGYSARFTTLPEQIQDEIMERELARVQ